MLNVTNPTEFCDHRALTINVGTSYICRQCGNLVMVTRGGVGMMELICCGKPMEKVEKQLEGGQTQ